MNPNIKLYHITETLKARVCFVNVPESAHSFEIANGVLEFEMNCRHLDSGWYGEKMTDGEQVLPYGDWQPLSRLSQVSEEQAAGIVTPYPEGVPHAPYFKGGETSSQIFFFNSAVEALKSLARSLNIPEDQDPVVLVEHKK